MVKRRLLFHDATMKRACASLLVTVMVMGGAGCGGRSAGKDDGTTIGAPVFDTRGDAGAGTSVGTPERAPTPAEPLPASPEPSTAPARNEGEQIVDGMLVFLERNCGACHGRSNPAVPPGELEFTYDMDRMVLLGLIIPGDGEMSPIYEVMSNGSMPPPGVEPRPNADEIIDLRRFIDDPRFWPELEQIAL
jgi:hypothetical protein